MSNIILNIGLSRSKSLTARRDPVNPQVAIDLLLAHGFQVQSVETHHAVLEGGESTLVVYGDDAPAHGSWVYTIAEALNQEAIAVWEPAGQSGSMIGPLANLWQFDKSKFIGG